MLTNFKEKRGIFTIFCATILILFGATSAVAQKTNNADKYAGRWTGTFADGAGDLEIKISEAGANSVKGEIIIKRAFAGKTLFSAAIVNGSIQDFACKAYLAGRCTAANLRLIKGKLAGKLIFDNGEKISHEFALTKTP